MKCRSYVSYGRKSSPPLYASCELPLILYQGRDDQMSLQIRKPSPRGSGCRAAEIRRTGLKSPTDPFISCINSHRRIPSRIRFDPAQPAGTLIIVGIMGTPCDPKEQGAATPVYRPMAPPGLVHRVLRNCCMSHLARKPGFTTQPQMTNLYATPGLGLDQTPNSLRSLRPTASILPATGSATAGRTTLISATSSHSRSVK